MRIGRISGHRRRHMKKVSNITTPHTQVNVRPTGGLSIHQSLPPHTQKRSSFYTCFSIQRSSSHVSIFIDAPEPNGTLKKTQRGDAQQQQQSLPLSHFNLILDLHIVHRGERSLMFWAAMKCDRADQGRQVDPWATTTTTTLSKNREKSLFSFQVAHSTNVGTCVM